MFLYLTLKISIRIIPLSDKFHCALSGRGIDEVDVFRHRYKSACIDCQFECGVDDRGFKRGSRGWDEMSLEHQHPLSSTINTKYESRFLFTRLNSRSYSGTKLFMVKVGEF